MAMAVPMAGVLLAFALGGRYAERVALLVVPIGLGVAVAIASTVYARGSALVYTLGGWAPPLGVALRADGLSAVMLAVTAVVICAVAAFAATDDGLPPATITVT